jgi:hypothetical protein
LVPIVHVFAQNYKFEASYRLGIEGFDIAVGRRTRGTALGREQLNENWRSAAGTRESFLRIAGATRQRQDCDLQQSLSRHC